jgi:hypothetical protein
VFAREPHALRAEKINIFLVISRDNKKVKGTWEIKEVDEVENYSFNERSNDCGSGLYGGEKGRKSGGNYRHR